MFGDNDDDFDVDEDFLKEVFDKYEKQSGTPSKLPTAMSNLKDPAVQLGPIINKGPTKRHSDGDPGDEDSGDSTKRKREKADSRPFNKLSLDIEMLSDDLAQQVADLERSFCLDEQTRGFSDKFQKEPAVKTTPALPPREIRQQPSVASTSTSFFKPAKPKMQRKFPGPAGLLPDIDRSGITEAGDLDKTISTSILETPMVPLNSQSASQATSTSAWQEAVKTLKINLGDPLCPLGRFTVAWARQMATAKRLPDHKVPFLLVSIRSLDPSSTEPSVVLQDITGEINGIIHQELWSEYACQLLPGSVLALRQVGVMSTGKFARHQCLNITANNVITIFTPEGSQQGAQTTHVRPTSREQLLQEAQFSPCPSPLSAQPQPSMFPTIGGSGLSVSRSQPPRSPAVSSTSSFGPVRCSTPRTSFSPRTSAPTKPQANTMNSYLSRPPSTNVVNPENNRESMPQRNKCDGFALASLPTNLVAKQVPPVTSQVPKPPVVNKYGFAPKSAASIQVVAKSSGSQFTPKAAFTKPASTFAPKVTIPPTKTTLPNNSSATIPCDVDSFLEGLDAEALFGDF